MDQTEIEINDQPYRLGGSSEESSIWIEPPKENLTIDHPSYYTDGNIEVSDFIADKNLNFFRGNVVKYIARAGKKDTSKEIEDLKKAKWYIQREIDRLGNLS